MAAEKGHHPNLPYFDQSGQFHMSGSVEFDPNELALAAKVSISAAAGTTNQTLVTFQFKDGAGNNLAACVPIDIWLSDAATGIGLTATTASGAVGAGASGTDFGALTAKKAIRSLTDATGKYILAITDTLKTGFFPCCSIPGTGQIAVGAQLQTANYG